MPVVNGMTGAHASKVNEFEMMKARENELEANVRRFHAMYGHARELAREVSRLEVLVQKKDDMAVLLLYQQQRQLF